MKIALPTKENNQIDAHFGHCEFYTIYTVSENNEITDKQILRSPAGCGCKSNIAFDLSQMDVKMMLAGGLYAIVCAAGSCGVAQERMGLIYFSISSMSCKCRFSDRIEICISRTHMAKETISRINAMPKM